MDEPRDGEDAQLTLLLAQWRALDVPRLPCLVEHHWRRHEGGHVVGLVARAEEKAVAVLQGVDPAVAVPARRGGLQGIARLSF